MATVHIVGAGMAGLACAVGVAKAGEQAIVYEASGRAGGRCRSFFDPAVERLIDNGNHLLLGANRAVFAYLADLGASGGLVSQDHAAFPFVDLASGERWVLRPSGGRIPWWIFSPSRRVPHSRWTDYLAALRLAWAGPNETVAQCLGGPGGPLYERLWRPLTDAVLNADPGEAAARLLWPVVYQTFGKGEASCRAYVARDGLSPDLVDPAIRFVTARGGEIRFGQRLRGVDFQHGRAIALDFPNGVVMVAPGDSVVIAIPPAGVAQLLPGVPTPEGTRAIVNAHYRLHGAVELPERCRFLGLVGGTAQWLFVRGEVVSVTVSAADALAEEPNERIAERLWTDVARALERPRDPRPPWRVVKEKRATFAQVPQSLSRRPGPRVGFTNLFLAGDWTDTGLPATIESAVLSGHRAARCALDSL